VSTYQLALGSIFSVNPLLGDLLATRDVKARNKSVPLGMAWMLAGVMGFFWKLLRLKDYPHKPG
jgi:hypothetical protein